MRPPLVCSHRALPPGSSTAAVCWDGSVVLADLISLPPAVLLSHSVALARCPESYAKWSWADKTVVELGCGIGALPALTAAFNGARRVVCTDGNADVLAATRANALQWAGKHPGVVPPLTTLLTWGDADHAHSQLRTLGVEAPVDVILAADCIYVLENPGAWGKLLTTIVSLSHASTLIFVSYTDRGHHKLWQRFVAQRVEKFFDVVEVGAHLLHPYAQPGAPGRLEQMVPAVQIFCWAWKVEATGVVTGSTMRLHPDSSRSGGGAAASSSAPPSTPPPTAPPSPPSQSPSAPASDERRRLAAIRLQSAQRGKMGREMAADEAMLAEAAEAMAMRATLAQTAMTAAAIAAARSSLFSARPIMSEPEAAKLLLTSAFLPDVACWETETTQQLVLLRASSYLQGPAAHARLPDGGVFDLHEVLVLPDTAAPVVTTRLGDAARAHANMSTSVHRFRIAQEPLASLLPALRTAAAAQRAHRACVQVSNVGGWHSDEQTFQQAADGDDNTEWYAGLYPILQAAIARIGEASSDANNNALAVDVSVDRGACDATQTMAGWLNSNGPCSFNALHDHGRDVEWSLVLFVATGEEHDAAMTTPVVAGSLGGCLLLKTQLGPVALGKHGYLPVQPTPGELWAFPGYLPHCVMPRSLGGSASPASQPATTPPCVDGSNQDELWEARQRVSVAVNLYTAASTAALSFVQNNMNSVLAARDRARAMKQAMEQESAPVSSASDPAAAD